MITPEGHEVACPAFGPKLIILDDLCTDEPLTAGQRERLMAWFVDDWIRRHPPRLQP